VTALRTLAAALFLIACGTAFAQAWPARPLRLVIAFPPGGPADIVGRAVAQKLGDALGQPLVVDNRPGGNANIGAEAAARAPADGHTLFLATSTHATNASLFRTLRYDLVRDFSPVARLATFPLVLVVNPALKVATTPQLVALARAKPGALSYASAGSGGGAHLAAESFKAAAGVDMVHVPYKGTGPAVIDLLSGQVGIMFASVPSVVGHIRAGKLLALGVTSAKRSTALPEVPAIAESGLAHYEIASWFGLMAPAGTPAAVVARIHQEANRILATPEFAKRLEAEGGDAAPGSPEEFGRFVRAEIERWAVIVRRSGARVE
jgi:tripartite-type tricarboxylate transporter receptor subunit TctC